LARGTADDYSDIDVARLAQACELREPALAGFAAEIVALA
jgi:hypothetical protein